MTRLLEDVTSMERMLIDGIEQGLMAVLQMVLVFAAMCYVSFKLTLFALSPVPFLARRALVHAHRAPALSIATARLFRHERVAAR